MPTEAVPEINTPSRAFLYVHYPAVIRRFIAPRLYSAKREPFGAKKIITAARKKLDRPISFVLKGRKSSRGRPKKLGRGVSSVTNLVALYSAAFPHATNFIYLSGRLGELWGCPRGKCMTLVVV